MAGPARLVVAGTGSGVGKTTVACGLMAAFAAQGRRVQPYKVGPDYLDPGYHADAAGRPARNLDSWLMAPAMMAGLFARAMQRADLAVIEGMMGLFDGKGPLDETGSAADVARQLDAPVLLVIDAWAMARSAAAVALGFRRFDPKLRLVGVLLNRVGGPGHYDIGRQAIEQMTDLRVFGYLPRREDWALPERHLGLVPTAERHLAADYWQRLAAQMAETVDLAGLRAVAESAAPLALPLPGLPERPAGEPVPIAVARDAAFNFYYEDNFELLEALGARLVPFSPLHDAALPPGTAGVIIGGGYPELFAAGLAANEPLRASLRAAAEQGMPIYAECGGLMYLAQELVDPEGESYPMVGVLPARTAMRAERVTIGYREGTIAQDHLLGPAGMPVRGHEFHWSTLAEPAPAGAAAYRLPGRPVEAEGFVRGNVVASYLHLHFGSDPRWAANLVEACWRWAAGVTSPPGRPPEGTRPARGPEGPLGEGVDRGKGAR